MVEYDVAIVGGGHNGLVAAGYHARARVKVVVLEQRPFVGGAVITEEPWHGYRINTFSYVAGLLRPQIVSPLDIERTLGMTGGKIFQGSITPDQIFSFRPILGWAGYRTPIRGVYLCGSAAHPGGGVTGVPGHNAAQVILEDLPHLPK